MKDKINKLIAHEKSARQLGNIDEANAFRKKIQELKSKEAESAERQTNQARRRPHRRRWKCSCGYELVLTDDDSAGTQVITDIMLSPHRGRGHQLTLEN